MDKEPTSTRTSAPRQPPAPPDDEPMQAWLREVNLQQLDLSEIDLDETPPLFNPTLVRGGIVATMLAFAIWFSSTNYYLLHGEGTWILLSTLFVALYAGAPLLIALVNRANGGRRMGSLTMPGVPSLPANWLRWGFLLLGVGLGGYVLFGMPREAEWAGRGYSFRWFFAVGGALTAGTVLGRWLIMQAEHQRARGAAAGRAFVLPPWFKWVTLGIIVAGGLFATQGHSFMGGDSESNRFATSGVGFVVGILAAIWLARRFDETEASIKKRRQAERAAAVAAAMNQPPPPA